MAIYSGLSWYVLLCMSTVHSSYMHLNLLMIWLGQNSLEWLIYLSQALVIGTARRSLSFSLSLSLTMALSMWSFSSYGASYVPKEHLNFKSSWSHDLEVTVLFLPYYAIQSNSEYNSWFNGRIVNCLLKRGMTKSSDRGHTYRNGRNS